MGDILRRRGMMMAQSTGGLPTEYQEVEYLQSSGTQYIDTQVVLADALKIFVMVDFRINDGVTGDNGILISTTSTASPYYKQLKFPNWYSGKIEVRGYGLNNSSATTLSAGTRATFTFDYQPGSQVCKKNGVTFLTGTKAWSQGPTAHLFMFANNDNGSIKWKAKASIYRAYIVADDVELRDFVPCYRKNDSKPGMYDLVNGVFYTNIGSGEFTVGPDV